MKSISGVVLAGGLSSRMQQDKRFLEYNGKTFLDTASSLLHPYCDNVFLSLASPPAFNTTLKVIADEFQNAGAISGILSCLNGIESDYILFIPVDMPLLKRHLIENLIVNIRGNGIKYEDYVFPFIIKNNVSVKIILQDLIKNNQFSIKNFLSAIDSLKLLINEEDKKYLENINYYEQFLGLTNAK
ncbi:MAG: molybdenum cofactor guanylyltransferase [Alphaproteobacteria bacterium]|jgi:molybdopterin-guanine dinucleotide biosynthesis protein A|nr:molybdenum cofactor guanylyltransferase [Alphaproteobacteria bacterium]